MINIVHTEINCNDKRQITSVRLKLKHFKDGDSLTEYQLVAIVSAAFYKTTLLVDEGKELTTTLDPKRKNIVDLTITLKKNDLTPQDICNFLVAFQQAMDNTKLF